MTPKDFEIAEVWVKGWRPLTPTNVVDSWNKLPITRGDANKDTIIAHFVGCEFAFKVDENNYQLTKLGRKLRQLGFAKCQEWQIESKKRKEIKEILEGILLENTVYLTTEQRRTDKNYRRWTLGAAIAAVIISLGALLIAYKEYRLKDIEIQTKSKEKSLPTQTATDVPLGMVQHSYDTASK